jgi:hypothetical protein
MVVTSQVSFLTVLCGALLLYCCAAESYKRCHSANVATIERCNKKFFWWKVVICLYAVSVLAILTFITFNPDPKMCAKMAAAVPPPTTRFNSATPGVHSPQQPHFGTGASRGTQNPRTTCQSMHSSSTVCAVSLTATAPLWQPTAARQQAYALHDPIPNSTGPTFELLPLAEAQLAISNSSTPTTRTALPLQQHLKKLPAAAAAAEAAAPTNTTCTVYEAPIVPAVAVTVTVPSPEAESAAPAQQCLAFQPLVKCPASATPAVSCPSACACNSSTTCGKSSKAPNQLWVELASSQLVRLEERLRTIVAGTAAWVQETTSYVEVSYRAVVLPVLVISVSS